MFPETLGSVSFLDFTIIYHLEKIRKKLMKSYQRKLQTDIYTDRKQSFQRTGRDRIYIINMLLIM